MYLDKSMYTGLRLDYIRVDKAVGVEWVLGGGEKWRGGRRGGLYGGLRDFVGGLVTGIITTVSSS